MMKKVFSLLLILAALTSCSSDVSDFKTALSAPRLKCGLSVNSFDAPAADNPAVTLSWTNNDSDASNILEIAADSLFSVSYSEPLAVGTNGITYTFRELNEITMGDLGMKQGVQASLYVRLAASLNEITVYSNMVALTVTPGAVLNAAELSCSTSDAVLSASAPGRLALSVSWTRNGVGVENTLEISKSDDFLNPFSIAMPEDSYDYQFTYGTLNQILVDELGMEANSEAPVYMRIVSSFETSAAYSNIITINVTPNASAADTDNVLWVCGLDDNLTQADSWTFDKYLIECNADYRMYSNVHYVDSKWGYRFYTEAGNWDNYYTRSSGDAYNGYLSFGASGNCYAPTPGLYLFDVSLSNNTYKLTAVTSVSCTGFNDNWNLKAMTPADGEYSTVYTASVTITKPATYRWQVILNNNWDIKLCATGGKLLLGQEGPATDEIANGTYTLIVDLAKGTYTLSPQ